jgi:methyltransferase
MTFPIIVTALIVVVMLAELRLSAGNERALRARGAIEPPDDVYTLMAWAYPASFVAMGIEGAIAGRGVGATAALGFAVMAGAKAIKYWAIASLGPRWSFRVLVIPGAPLVETGPYAWMRHPNYVGVMGELLGAALLTGAPVAGVMALAGFGLLLRRRIAIEEQSLGRHLFTRRMRD